MSDRYFGELLGTPPGSSFADRAALAAAGVHRPLVAGICGGASAGAESIVLNGGYIDDVDQGSELVYTGAGGNDAATKNQTADQSFDHPPNAALVTSESLKLPVRVIRGYRGDPAFSPRVGYRYDGLFLVTEHWMETGIDGYKICRFPTDRTNEVANGWRVRGDERPHTARHFPSATTSRCTDLSAPICVG